MRARINPAKCRDHSAVKHDVYKSLALYLANIKVAFRSIVILIAVMLALVALVLVSLPRDLFSAQDIPKISLAIVYGDGTRSDAIMRNLSVELGSVEMVENISICMPDEAEEQLKNGEVDAIIFLPDDMLDALVYGGHTTITVRANDALIGAVIFSICDRTIGALDRIQNYSLIFQQEAQGLITPYERYESAVTMFNLVLLTEASTRMQNIDIPSPVSPYYAQALTLLLFLVVSIASLFVAVIAARQYSSGYIRHLHTRGVRFRHLFGSQLLVAASISLVLSLVLSVILSFVGEGLRVVPLCLSSVLLSLVLTALYLMFSGFKQQSQVATTRTLIGCLALMFFLLFAGGGFYPTGLMSSDLRLFNPTWLSNQLAVWSLGGSLDTLQLLVFVVPFALAGAVCFFEWRRAL